MVKEVAVLVFIHLQELLLLNFNLLLTGFTLPVSRVSAGSNRAVAIARSVKQVGS